MMQSRTFRAFDASRVPSPCFVVDRAAVEDNLRQLQRVGRDSGAKILGALKAFSCWALADLNREYLWGSCASGLHEARLAREYYGGEVHTYSAAFKDEQFDEILALSDHVVFNSFSQWRRFRERCLSAQRERPELRFGLRINPQHSEGEVALYDPCAPGSRMGVPVEAFSPDDLAGLSGLHFHTLCEQDVPPLARTLDAVERQFGDYLAQMEWVNFGGGHHITRPGYQVDELVRLIRDFRERHDVQVYLEPGEAVAIRTGVLVAQVLDVFDAGAQHAILDTSATCHMPDTLEMPYRAEIIGAGEPGEYAHTYRLGGMTCLAGDVMGDYSFARPLCVGQRLTFDDMAHYTMVKTTTFNGIHLPSIAVWDSRSDELQVIKCFDYKDFKSRLS